MRSAGFTTAAIIRFSQDLENSSSAFYEGLARRWAEHQDTFMAFAGDSKKNASHIVRTYQETISDAYEASYSFEGLDLEDFVIEMPVATDASLIEGLERAITLEKTACAFYRDIAARSESLLATIPRAFKRVAERRKKRQAKLENLLKHGGSDS